MSTAAPRPRNRRGEGTKLRDDIVRAAALLLTEVGGEHAVTLRSVARQVGISAPSIYAHFPDRDAILLAVAQEAFTELEQRLTHAANTGRDGVEGLRAVCQAYLDFAVTEPHRYRIMFGGVWNAEHALRSAPERHRDLTELGMATFAVLVDAVTTCVEAGRSSSTDPMTSATALWVGLHGLGQLRTAAPLFPWPPDITDHLIGALTGLV